MVARSFAKLMAPLARRVRLMVRRAVVKLVYDDVKMQELQLAIFSGEVRDHVERWQDYGLTSSPLPGAEALVAAIGGNTDHCAVVKVDDRRYRLKNLANGEVALYDDQGQVIHLKRDKTIHIYGCDTLIADVATATTVTCPLVTVVAETKVVFDTPRVECTGDFHADGEVSDGVRALSADREIYNDHDHPETGSTTGKPNQEM